MNTSPSRLFRGFQLITMVVGDVPYGLRREENLLVQDGLIVWTGEGQPPGMPLDTEIVEGHGLFLSPGLIDCHTHLVYGGNRAEEWEQRLMGVPYEEIARRGGGILSTVAATRAATDDELFDSARKRLVGFLRQGVTTVEIKSGYGLTLESELKMLRIAGRLDDELPVSVSATLLAAHAVPPEFRGRGDDYVDRVCQEYIPAAAGMCDAVDVFCESIAFDLKQTEKVFRAAVENGLAIKVHAEQLSNMGGAALAAEMGAWSADHLEYLSDADAGRLAAAGTVATLLPGAYYTLRQSQRPPVAALRQAGASLAIATDSNPGSSPLASVLLTANMACTLFGLTPEESLAGLTRIAARALRRSDQLGTLETGKRADFAIWDINHPAELAYGLGHNPCVGTVKAGSPTVGHPGQVDWT